MKKILPILLVLCLTLAACGDKGGEGYDVHGATKALLDSGAFSLELEETPANALFNFSGYGLDEEKLTASKAYAASGFAEQVLVTVWKSDADAKAAETATGDYLQDLKDMNANYVPEEIAKLNSAIVSRQGNSVLVVVPADADAANAAVDRLG